MDVFCYAPSEMVYRISTKVKDIGSLAESYSDHIYFYAELSPVEL